MPNSGDVILASDFNEITDIIGSPEEGETILSNIEELADQLASTLSQASSANTNANTAKSNTATNNTASSTGTLSQKLSYIINQLTSSNSGGGYTSGMQIFTSSGTFTVPDGVGIVYITACGGGGSGSAGTAGSGRGAGGAGAECIWEYPVSVTPGQQIPITIGAGGVGPSSGVGANGGTTSFGTLLTIAGGNGGTYNSSDPGVGGAAKSLSGQGGFPGEAGGNSSRKWPLIYTQGETVATFAGGAGYVWDSCVVTNRAGGGGASIFGAGGKAPGGNGGIGAGGAGGSNKDTTSVKGGNGGNGKMVIRW